MTSDSVIRIIGVCVAVLLLLGWFGSRFITIVGLNGKSATDVAKEIVANHEDPVRCNTIYRFDFFGSPPQGIQRGLCFYTVAELTKDPTVCKYIMPSDYGNSCIGAALNAAGLNECVFMGDKSVRWLDNGDLKQATLQDCKNSNQTTAIAKNCCYISQLTFTDSVTDCSGIHGNPNLLDLCYYQLAQKKNDSTQCRRIQNAIRRSACELRLGVPQK